VPVHSQPDEDPQPSLRHGASALDPAEHAWLEEQCYLNDLLTDADIPPDEPDNLLHPDPADTSSRPVELAGLTFDELDDLMDAAVPAGQGRPAQPAWPLCYLGSDDLSALSPHDGTGLGCGFADGGVLDTLPAGIPLAMSATDSHDRIDDLDDDSLVGLVRAWRRVTSWAQARELAAISALAGRRPADGYPPTTAGQLPVNLSEFVGAELAAALTLTAPAAEAQLGLAVDFTGRPATWAALDAGRIDLPRAMVIMTLLAELGPEHAAKVEADVLPQAPDMTTSQLRRALRRAILKLDPEAAQRRREQAERSARVETWTDPEGTATLAGRNLPPAQTLAASKRLTQIAAAWKKQGAVAGMDLLRAHAYLALLNGLPIDLPPASLLPLGALSADDERAPANSTAAAAPGGDALPAGLRRTPEPELPPEPKLPPLAGLINLTVPLTTLLGLGEAPGEAAGFGPVDAGTARQLACALAGHRATRWAITVTGPSGYALAHGTGRGNPALASGATVATAGTGGGWTVRVTAEPIATADCDHRKAEPGYRPSPALRALVRARSRTCSFYGCGRQAVRCDLDHVIPHDQGGLTCECNMAPLCRYHHRVKQAENWKLEQISPGVMAWLTPAGRRYITLPSQHPT
jgi:hypothetical protein